MLSNKLRGRLARVLGTMCMVTHDPDADRVISKGILSRGTYGHADTFATVFAAMPGSLMLDVGANIGFHTLQALALGLHTVSFEPHPHNAALLQSSLQRNCIAPGRAALVQAAASNATETLTLSMHPSSPGMSSLADKRAIPLPMGGEGREFVVDVTSVDRAVSDRCAADWPLKISLMKVDVEGFEERALRGATKLLDGSLRCKNGGRLAPPAFVHIEVFPMLLRAAGSDPAEPLRILAKNYRLFVGVGGGHGGRVSPSVQSAWQQLGARPSGAALELPAHALTRFVDAIAAQKPPHVDFMAQRRQPPVPAALDLRANASAWGSRPFTRP